MVCLKFESCNIILCILILYAFMCDLETEATYIKKYSMRHDKVAMLETVEVPNKLINAPRLHTSARPVLRLQGGKLHPLSPNRNIHKRSTKKDGKIALLGDAYCALCITVGNLTCIQRYCNQAKKQGPASTKKYRFTAIA